MVKQLEFSISRHHGRLSDGCSSRKAPLENPAAPESGLFWTYQDFSVQKRTYLDFSGLICAKADFSGLIWTFPDLSVQNHQREALTG